MAMFTVRLTDQTTDLIEGADAYQQEGPMTTFFAFTDDRRVIDSWSRRLASYRTAEVSAIRRGARSDYELDSPAGDEVDTDIGSEDVALVAS